MVRFKQNEVEYNANIVAVEKRLLPAVLAATRRNGDLLASWLMKNCAEGDVVDASTQNILKAVRALDGAGLVDWQIAPKPQKKKPDFLQSNDGRRVTAREAQEREQDILMSQERTRREALGDQANREIMAEAVALVQKHSSVSHSRTYRERASLKAEFDRLNGKVHPKDLLAALQAKQNTFADADITRPRLGGR
jgi:hypothetical protein